MSDVPQQEPYPYQPQPYYGSPAYGPPTTYPQPKNGLGTAGMVLGIIGLALFWFPYVGVTVALVGLGLAIPGMVRVKHGAASNKGVAIAGLVVSILGVAVGGLWTIAVTVAANDASNDYDRYSDCLDHTRLANWDRCERYLD